MRITFENQLEVTKLLTEKTKRRVYFDGADLVDFELNRTIFKDALLGNYSIQDYVNAIVLLMPYTKRD